MMEILGRMPKNFGLSGKHAKRYFDDKGNLLKIKGLQHWPLKKVLMEKYKMKEEEAEQLADFLLPMLEWYPEKRATAQEMLSHPWLNLDSNYDTHISEAEFQKIMLKKKLLGEDEKTQEEAKEYIDSDDECFCADSEDNLRSFDSESD